MQISIGALLRGTVDQLVGLIVDDGFVAVGAVVALVVTAWLAGLPGDAVPHDALGVFLFAVVAVVLLASLARAGRAARVHAVPPSGSVADPAD